MIAGGTRPREGHAAFLGCGSGLVQVEDHLHVIGDETDRHNHDCPYATPSELTQMIVDVWLQPWLAGGPEREQ